MTARKAVVFAVDGLRTSALGTYGNTWHPTPALDALAAHSLVVDWMWCASIELAACCLWLWNGGQQSLPRRLAAVGVASSLITDDSTVADWADAAAFGEVWRVETVADAPAADVSQTAMAQLMAAAAERLAAWADGPPGDSRLLWIHARGFHGPWDAPLELRAGLLDEDDPDPPTFVDPPGLVATDDHDAILTYHAAYAAQTIVLDKCLGGLLAALAELGFNEETLVVLVGCRGFALGEHGVVGGDFPGLYGETLHVPCLLRVPVVPPAPPRYAGLARLADVQASLAAWFGAPHIDPASAVDLLSADAANSPHRQFVAAIGAGDERALRTPAWMLRLRPTTDDQGAADASDRVELYAKPDDRWEANEVADRCSDVAERLLAVLQRLESADGDTAIEPLDADLIEPAR